MLTGVIEAAVVEPTRIIRSERAEGNVVDVERGAVVIV